ncbi:LOW QUALITY PROTEIN: hypothetical protein KUTeg_020659, partial [Tegillarca granosa]
MARMKHIEDSIDSVIKRIVHQHDDGESSEMKTSDSNLMLEKEMKKDFMHQDSVRSNESDKSCVFSTPESIDESISSVVRSLGTSLETSATNPNEVSPSLISQEPKIMSPPSAGGLPVKRKPGRPRKNSGDVKVKLQDKIKQNLVVAETMVPPVTHVGSDDSNLANETRSVSSVSMEAAAPVVKEEPKSVYDFPESPPSSKPSVVSVPQSPTKPLDLSISEIPQTFSVVSGESTVKTEEKEKDQKERSKSKERSKDKEHKKEKKEKKKDKEKKKKNKDKDRDRDREKVKKKDRSDDFGDIPSYPKIKLNIRIGNSPSTTSVSFSSQEKIVSPKKEILSPSASPRPDIPKLVIKALPSLSGQGKDSPTHRASFQKKESKKESKSKKDSSLKISKDISSKSIKKETVEPHYAKVESQSVLQQPSVSTESVYVKAEPVTQSQSEHETDVEPEPEYKPPVALDSVYDEPPVLTPQPLKPRSPSPPTMSPKPPPAREKSPSPAPREPSPAPKQPSPAPREPSPPTREPSPSTREPSPVNEPSPPPKTPSPSGVGSPPPNKSASTSPAMSPSPAASPSPDLSPPATPFRFSPTHPPPKQPSPSPYSTPSHSPAPQKIKDSVFPPLPPPSIPPMPPPSSSVMAKSSSSVHRTVVAETVSTFYDDNTGQQIWICPACKFQDDGSPMIGCDICDDWYH